jgi:hypothetical protein
MIKKILVMSAVAANCYAMDAMKEGELNDVSRLAVTSRAPTLSDNQSPAVQTGRTDQTDHMITIYDDGVIVYGAGL